MTKDQNTDPQAPALLPGVAVAPIGEADPLSRLLIEDEGEVFPVFTPAEKLLPSEDDLDDLGMTAPEPWINWQDVMENALIFAANLADIPDELTRERCRVAIEDYARMSDKTLLPETAARLHGLKPSDDTLIFFRCWSIAVNGLTTELLHSQTVCNETIRTINQKFLTEKRLKAQVEQFKKSQVHKRKVLDRAAAYHNEMKRRRAAQKKK